MTANVSNTEDSAVAANAPSTIGDHCTKRGAISLRAVGVMFSIDMCKALTEAEEGQHCQDHDQQADEIDKTVHGLLHMSRAILDRQSSGIGKVPEISRKKLQPQF